MDDLNRKMIRKMGFIKDQEGIMNRFFREGAKWEPHLERSRNFILNSFRDRGIHSLAILGSGWLLDLPLEELADRYDQILLIDIYHPPQVRHRVKPLKNVSLQEADLSGGAIEYCWNLRKSMKRKERIFFPDHMKLKIPDLLFEAGAMISLNLLNQLDILLIDYINAGKYFQHFEIERFRTMIQQFHLDWITGKPGTLITDVREINIDRNGNESSNTLLYTSLPEGIRRENWKWDFDAYQTYRPGSHTTMEVQAIEW